MIATNRLFADSCADDLRFSEEAIARLKKMLTHVNDDESRIIQKMIDAHTAVQPFFKNLVDITRPQRMRRNQSR